MMICLTILFYNLQRTLEVVTVIVSATQLFCTGAIHAGAQDVGSFGTGRVWNFNLIQAQWKKKNGFYKIQILKYQMSSILFPNEILGKYTYMNHNVLGVEWMFCVHASFSGYIIYV